MLSITPTFIIEPFLHYSGFYTPTIDKEPKYKNPSILSNNERMLLCFIIDYSSTTSSVVSSFLPVKSSSNSTDEIFSFSIRRAARESSLSRF